MTIKASADDVFAVVSNPVAMADLAEELVAVRWLHGAAQAALGARFIGFNRNGWRRWRTVCVIVDLQPGRRFTYDVNTEFRVPISRWRYDIEPAPDGTCAVTQSNWARIPLWFLPLAIMITGVVDRPATNAANIATTLNRLKTHLESRLPGGTK